MHQFMNHNAAIFHDLARAQASNMEFAADTVREAAEDARALAVRVAARVLGKAEQDVEPADAKPFRTAAAALLVALRARSEERRVGTGCVSTCISRGSTYTSKNKKNTPTNQQ